MTSRGESSTNSVSAEHAVVEPEPPISSPFLKEPQVLHNAKENPQTLLNGEQRVGCSGLGSLSRLI